MSRKYKFHNNSLIYFVSFAVIQWIDLFIRDEYRSIIIDSLKFCQLNKDMDLYAWVLMTSHMHMILGSRGLPLPNIMQDFKRHTSEKLHQEIVRHPRESRKKWMLGMMEQAGRENSNNINFQCWQQDNHPISLITPFVTFQKLGYLHYNPVAGGFVEKPEDWLYSSARNYCGLDGLIEVKFL